MATKRPEPVEPTEGPERRRLPHEKKTAPTPSRASREAAQVRPLVPNDRAEQKAKLREARNKRQESFMAGDESAMPPRDKGPQRRFIRDYVDSRFNLGEILIPMMLVVLIIMNVLVQYSGAILIGLWLFVGLAIFDAILAARRAKRRIAEVVGESRLEKGLMFYSVMRSIQFRFLRAPRTQVKVGTKVNFAQNYSGTKR